MGDLQYNPNEDSSLHLSGGSVIDFVSALTADPSDAPRPSLSEFFNEKGIDAGLSFHSGPKVYIEANPWTLDDRETPADGMDGTITQRQGNMSFGFESNLNDEHVGYVQGEYSVTFGHGGWTPPETETVEYPVYDDDGNEVGVEAETYDYEGFHDYDGPITTLSVIGNAYTDGNYHLAGIAEHDRTINVSGRDFDINTLGAIGLDNDYGAFATAHGEISTLVHGDTNTRLYAGASVLLAENDQFSHKFVEGGVETSVLKNIPAIGGALPPVRAGVQYDGDNINPALSIGWNF